MEYKKPTYEEYCKASFYARVRYRFGVYIQFVAVLLFCYLLFYTITNIEEMKANPMDYAEEKLGVVCSYPITEQIFKIDYNYGSNGSFSGIE